MDTPATLHVLKFILIGDSNVGKSQLASRFSKDVFNEDSQQTIGMEFATRELHYYGNTKIGCQIWDTAGQERFFTSGSGLPKAYYRGSVGAMLVYDITSRASFENLPYWLKQLKEHTHRNIAVSLVGNKCDREHERAVSTAEGLEFAESHGMDFVESSAREGVNVETAFRRLIMAVAQLLPEGKERLKQATSRSPSFASATDGGAETELPDGWVRVPSLKRPGEWSYENIWTGERISHLPTSAAVEFNSIQVPFLQLSC